MEAFEGEGVFWVPDDKETQRTGRIRFDPTEGTTLSLFGNFGDLQQGFTGTLRIPRIHGVAGGRYLTLEGCFSTNTTVEMPGIPRQTIQVGSIIADYCFDQTEPLVFDEVVVAFDQLPSWIRRSGVTVNFTQYDDQKNVDEVDIDFRRLDDQVVQLDNFDLYLTSSWGVRGDHITNTQLIQGTHLKIRYRAPQNLDFILEDVKALQDLLTLATDAPTVPEEITLRRKDLTREVGPDTVQPLNMSFYAPQLAERVRLKAPQSPGRVLFQYDSIGGLATIARWLVVARIYHIVLGSLLSIRYATGLYVQNRLHNVISAAESFHRGPRFSNEVTPENVFHEFIDKLLEAVPEEYCEWLSGQLQYSNEPRLRRRLKELIKYAGPTFNVICGTSSKWVSVVVEIRNRLTHYDENRRSNFNGGDLHFLAESVFLLVMLCLFRECGVGDDVLARVSESMSMQFLHQRLGETMPRLYAAIHREQDGASAAENDSDLYGQYKREAETLGQIGAAIFPQPTTVSIRLPQDLADLAVAAWRREDKGPIAPEETTEQWTARHRASTLDLIGRCIEQTGKRDSAGVLCEIDSWYIGGAFDAAEHYKLLANRERATSQVTPAEPLTRPSGDESEG